MISTVRVQEKGQVTIPQNVRRQLNLKKGDLVTFVSTENGVVIKTLDLAAEDLLATLETLLQDRGVRLSDLLARSRQIGAETLVREFNLRSEERNLLFQALQLKAQIAVEAIRTASESGSVISDEDIEAEIQEMRKEP